MWERSFVATSVLLSVPLDEALAALPQGSEMRSETPAQTRVAELSTKLRDGRRAVRAGALADVGKEIAMALAEITLR